MPPTEVNAPNDSQNDQTSQCQNRFAPVHLRQQERDDIQQAAWLLRQGRRLGEFLGAGQFISQDLHHLWNSEVQNGRVCSNEATDVNRRYEHIKIAFLQCSQVISADLGRLGDLVNRELSRFAGGSKLFGNGWHDDHVLLDFVSFGNSLKLT